MDIKFMKIMKELVDEYQPTIDSIENERDRQNNEAVVRIAIEVAVKALEKYEAQSKSD